VIRLAGKVLLGHAADGGGIEDAGGGDEGRLGKIQRPRLQILLEPGGDGHGEAGLFALKNGLGEILTEGLAEDDFGLAAAELVVGAKGEGVGDEIDVEEGDAHLKGVGHGGAIDLHEDALLEVEFGAEIEEAFQAAGQAAALGQTGDILEGVGPVELCAGVGGEEVAALRVAAGAHPEEETDFRGKTEAFDELGEEKRKAFVVVGDGQALDEMVDGVADGDGEEGESFDEKMSLEAGVAGKEFVAAVAAEDGFDLGGGEAGEEPSGHEGGVAEGFVQTGVDFGEG
jgi:hypothetical protein